MAATRGDRRLTAALLRHLNAAGDPDGAAGLIRAELERGGRQVELWRALCHVYQELRRPEEARLAATAVVALGAATAEDLQAIRRAPPRPGGAAEGSMGAADVEALAVDRTISHPAAALLAACAESIAKLFPSELSMYGLSKKDRIAAGEIHPVREWLDRLCAVLGVECDLYERSGGTPMVAIGPTEPVSIFVNKGLGSLPAAQQVFLLGRALTAMAVGLHPVLLVPSREFPRLLTAAARAALPEFGGADPGLEELAHRIRKGQSRKWRKAHESAAAAYAAAPLTNAGGWQRQAAQTLNRAATLLADDVSAAVAALPSLTDAGTSPPPKSQPLAEEAADLLRFWMSEPATRFRRRAGLLSAS
jgi:hypothetical protein